MSDFFMRYTKKNMTREWLLSNGFHYNKLFSNENDDVYTYKFPVYRYSGHVILECELRVIPGENTIFIDVYDRNTINKYIPFYYNEYGNYNKMLKHIHNEIRKTLDNLNIKRIEGEKEYGNKSKEIKRKCYNSNKRKQKCSRI